MRAGLRKENGYTGLMAEMMGIVCHKVRKAFFIMVLCAVNAGLLQGAVVWFKQRLFDGAKALTEGGSVRAVGMAGITLGICLAVQLVFSALNRLAETHFVLKMEQAAGERLNRKAAGTDPICFEDNRFLDQIEKANRGMEAAVNIFSMSLGILLTILSYFGFMGTYLFHIEPVLLIVLLLSFVPYMIGAAVRYHIHKNMENQSAPYRRKEEYYGRCITDREYAREVRLLGGYSYFFKKMQESLCIVKKLSWKTIKKSELVDIGLRIFSMTGYLGTIALLFYFLMAGRVSVGAFAAIASSLDSMSDTLERIFNFRLNQITSSLGMAENYLAFLKLPERKGSGKFPEGRSVEFSHVTFAYPEASGNSIEDLNLIIKDKETVAIVGKNGAGKSTFARLLMGIYLPSSGNVYLDGYDTKGLNPKDSEGRLSAVFQQFQKYKMRIRDNVYLSNTAEPADDIMIKEALFKADMDWQGDSFPEGLDTMLSREFGGIDLSGGQWQRLAIARGFYRRHNLILLDEPTAAIDPLEETAVYRKFSELSRDKTAVIITHRLGSAKIADRILVLDNGRLVEMGKHKELMEKKGLYYEMYQAQAKWYA